MTRLPALASRSVRPNPSSPVPPMTEMSMAAEPTCTAMGQTLTYLTEIAVGLVVVAVPTMRSPGRRWLAAVLAVAGLTAIVHAVSRLVA